MTEPTTVSADAIVLAAGPWLGQLGADLLSPDLAAKVCVTGSQANAIILKPKEALTAHAVFARIQMGGGPGENEPEVYCRPDGTTYLCVSRFQSSEGPRRSRVAAGQQALPLFLPTQPTSTRTPSPSGSSTRRRKLSHHASDPRTAPRWSRNRRVICRTQSGEAHDWEVV